MLTCWMIEIQINDSECMRGRKLGRLLLLLLQGMQLVYFTSSSSDLQVFVWVGIQRVQILRFFSGRYIYSNVVNVKL
jgi:hypothetical protein